MTAFELILFHTDGDVIAVTGWGLIAFFMLIGSMGRG